MSSWSIAVQAGVDQRVLLGELAQRLEEGRPVGRVASLYDGLQAGRREVPTALGRVPRAELVADLDVGEADDLGDVTGVGG